jgi:selenocysteine lyase/cysteine desulfurase
MEDPAKPSAFDVDFARAQFPAFASGLPAAWAHFDNAGGTYTCGAVLDRLTQFYRNNKVQPYGANALAAAAGEQMDEGRRTMAELLGVPMETLTLGPSTTQNINTLCIAAAAFVGRGDEIVVSEQDHEANIGGWERLARLTGATLRIWPADPESGELDLADLEKTLSRRTRVVSVTHSSNIIGTVNPIGDVVRLARGAGARVVVDGVSYAPHQWPDIASYGVDAYCFSTYKTFATHLGVMYVSPDFMEQLTPQCHYFNAHKPWARLDAAGPDHASIAALAGLGEYFRILHRHHFGPSDKPLNAMALEVLGLMHRHEAALAEMLLDTLRRLPVRVIGRADMNGREANVSFVSAAHSSASLAAALARKGIATKHSHFYAYRLIEKLGIADPADGVLRLSFAHYNTQDETRRLIDALTHALE